MVRQCILISTKRTFNSKDDKTIAEDFNRLFVSVGQSTVNNIQFLANECDLTLNAYYFVPRLHPLSEQFTLGTVESKQIESLVASMASNKSTGIDKIPYCIPYWNNWHNLDSHWQKDANCSCSS